MNTSLTYTDGLNSYHPFFQSNGYYWLLIGLLAQEIERYLPDAQVNISLENERVIVATITTKRPVERAIKAFNRFFEEWGKEHLCFANFVVVLEYGQLRIIRESTLGPLLHFYTYSSPE